MAKGLAQFVTEHRPAWEALAALTAKLGQGALAPAEVFELDALYRRASADLALARLHYPATEATRHLDQLVARAYGALHARRPRRLAALRTFWFATFPGAFWQHRRFFAAAWALLLAGLWIGAALVTFHPETASALVGAGVRAHIAEGHLWTDDALEAMPPALLATRIFAQQRRGRLLRLRGRPARGDRDVCPDADQRRLARRDVRALRPARARGWVGGVHPPRTAWWS